MIGSAFAPYANLAELHHRTYARQSNEHRRECEPSFTLDWQIEEARREIGEDQWNVEQADWRETERLLEAARVEHGRGTPAYRAAWREIIDRKRVPNPCRAPNYAAIDYPEGRS